MIEFEDQSREVYELVEKNKIYENLMKYVRGQDRKDLDLMKSAYWPDATDNHAVFVGNGHEFCDGLQRPEKIRACCFTSLFECSHRVVWEPGEV